MKKCFPVLRLTFCRKLKFFRKPFRNPERSNHLLNKIIFAISNRKTKTSELLLIKYIKISNLFVIESHHDDVDHITYDNRIIIM